MKRFTFCLTTFFVASQAFAEVPHTFKAGEPAKASEVNENFQYLENKIQNVSTGLTRLLKNNGDTLGYLMGMGSVSGVGNFQVITPQKYSLHLSSTSDGYTSAIMPFNILYESNDCSGQGFLNFSSSMVILNSFGLIFQNTVDAQQEDPWYYIPIGSNPVTITVNSEFSPFGGACDDSGSWGEVSGLFPLQPNNPSITGFDAADLTPPLTFKFPFEE